MEPSGATASQPPSEADSAAEAGPKWILASGSPVYALSGLPEEQLKNVPTDKLRVEHFAVAPDEVTGWQEMSKNQLKKRMADIRWVKLKDERQSRKAARQASSSKRPRSDSEVEEEEGAQQQQQSSSSSSSSAGAKRRKALRDAIDRGIKIAIDCSYDELMSQKERHSLAEQIKQAYGSIRGARHPLNMYLTSLSPSSEVYDTLRRVTGFLPGPGYGGNSGGGGDGEGDAGAPSMWPIHVFSEPYTTVFGAAAAGTESLIDVRLKSNSALSAASGTSAVPSEPTSSKSVSSTVNAVEASIQPSNLANSEGAHETESACNTNPDALFTGSSNSNSSSSAALPASTQSKAPPSVVYLSADSPHVLSELRHDTVYVIGGLIDRNRHKGLAQARAEAAGITTARLPIDQFVQLQASRMLTTLHVVQILLAWQDCGRDWKRAFLTVIPPRKGLTADAEEEEEEEEEGSTA